MKRFFKLLVLILSITLLNFSHKEEKTCQIIGTVVDSDTESILLLKPNQDWRFDEVIEIPVIDGKFYFETKLQYPEAVTLFLGEIKDKGSGRYMRLYLENEKIELTIHSEENFDKNRVRGGMLNAEYEKYEQGFEHNYSTQAKLLDDSLRVLYETGKFHSDKMKEVLAEIEKSSSQEETINLNKKAEELRSNNIDKTPEANKLIEKLEGIYKEENLYAQKRQQEHMEKNPTIVSYSFFLQDLIFRKATIDINLARSNFKKLSQANPNHPYNELAIDLLNAIENIKVGETYVDFSAPDLNGKLVKLSDEIKGKVALLDLWATWCGPCIAKSKTMIPVYNEHKDKGFTIVGVAGEYKSTTSLVKFLEREKWPWLNLVELDRQNMIWQKYGADNSGGAMFLIDREGKILAKDPTADEVRFELEKHLNR